MNQIRIAGKRIQTIELYLYILAAVMAGLAYVLAANLRDALTPSIFSPYAANFMDGAFVVMAGTAAKILMRLYEHSTAESRLKYFQLSVTAGLIFFVFAVAAFYFQPSARIPISMILTFIVFDQAAGLLLMPAHYFFSQASVGQRTIGVIADRELADRLAGHRKTLLSQKANFLLLDQAAFARNFENSGEKEWKAAFDEIIVDRRAASGVPDWNLLLRAREAGIPIQTPDSFLESEFGEALVEESAALDVILASSSSWNQIRVIVKRLFDLVAGAIAGVILVPIALLTAAAIGLDGKGPVFFRQARVGRNGRVFRIWKFRTMVVNAEAVGPASTAAGDPRVTRVGRFLRRTRLDEIPQLVNVLWGDMSLVGPRPQMPANVAEWSKAAPLYHLRHLVKPGVTGWAQVRFAYIASPEEARVALSYDLFYVKNYSLALDIMVLLLTPRIVLAGEGGR